MSNGNALNLSLPLTNGQIFIGNGSLLPSKSTITAGQNINIINGNGSISISSPGTFNPISVTTALYQMVNGEVYIPNFLVPPSSFVLPTTSAVGDTVTILGGGTGGWIITYGTGQYMMVNSSKSTVSIGNMSSNGFRGSAQFVCVVANIAWSALFFSSQFAVT